MKDIENIQLSVMVLTKLIDKIKEKLNSTEIDIKNKIDSSNEKNELDILNTKKDLNDKITEDIAKVKEVFKEQNSGIKQEFDKNIVNISSDIEKLNVMLKNGLKLSDMDTQIENAIKNLITKDDLTNELKKIEKELKRVKTLKDGKNGSNGKDGKNGLDGKDGLNGKDAIIPLFEVLETETITSNEKASVELINDNGIYKFKFKLPKGNTVKINGSAVIGTSGKNLASIIVDTYDDLPETATQGDLVLIRRDCVVPKTVNMILGHLYEKAYFNPNINVGGLGFTQDFFAGITYGENGDIQGDFEIYPDGDGVEGPIQAPYIDVINTSLLEYIDDVNLTAVQTLWLYISETIEFWIAGQAVTMKEGWNRLSAKIKSDDGAMQYYDILIDYNSPPKLQNVKLGQLNDDWDDIQNQIFDENPYVVHYSGIYEYCEDLSEWRMIMQSSNFKPEILIEEELPA